VFHLHPSLSLAETQVVIDKLQQPVNVFVKVLNVVMSGTIDPQWLDWVWTTLVDGTAVGEIDYLILLAMDHQHGRCYLLDLVNAASQYDGYMVRVLRHFKHANSVKSVRYSTEYALKNCFRKMKLIQPLSDTVP